MNSFGKLIVISGPSCVGKSPLMKALAQFHPQLTAPLHSLVLYNSRDPRPGEKDGVDYHFRSRGDIERLRQKENFVVMDVRGDLQALDLDEMHSNLKDGNALFEGNPFIGCMLLTHPKFENIERVSIFVAPLSKEELSYLMRQPEVDLMALVADVMRRKLLRRMQRQKTLLSLKDLEEVERRAGSAYRELLKAPSFQWVVPNHDGEDSENWNAFYFPLGDAGKTLRTVVALLKGEHTLDAERWEPDFLPPEGAHAAS